MKSPNELYSLVQRLDAARTIRAEVITAMQSVFEGVKTGMPVHNATVQQTVQMLIDTISRDHDVLLCVNHLRQFDDELFSLFIIVDGMLDMICIFEYPIRWGLTIRLLDEHAVRHYLDDV